MFCPEITASMIKKQYIFVLGINLAESKPSLRYVVEDDIHDHNYIKVTPEFQDYVSKNLFKLLER